MKKENAKRDEMIGMERREGKIVRLFFESGRIVRLKKNENANDFLEVNHAILQNG